MAVPHRFPEENQDRDHCIRKNENVVSLCFGIGADLAKFDGGDFRRQQPMGFSASAVPIPMVFECDLLLK